MMRTRTVFALGVGGLCVWQTQLYGCWRVAALYDPVRPFPTWCVADRVGSGRRVDEYRVTEWFVEADKP